MQKGFVAPAKAGAQKHAHKKIKHFWILAGAGMTEKTLLREFCINLLAANFHRIENRVDTGGGVELP